MVDKPATPTRPEPVQQKTTQSTLPVPPAAGGEVEQTRDDNRAITTGNYVGPKTAPKDLPAPKAPAPVLNKIPDGAIDPHEMRPGYGPLEGSPKENDPSKLQNPENPNSPITKPLNPSNPANMPQTQSEKTASELGIHQRLTGVENLPRPYEGQKEREAERKELAEKINATLQKHGLESNIPVGDEYFNQINRLRVLNNP